MATLKPEHKTFIIQQLACFQTPSAVAALVKEEFGLEIDRQQIAFYDPKNKHSEISDKLKTLFDETRKVFISETAAIGVAHATYRLRELQSMYDRHNAASRKNDVLLMSILKQAAEETGDKFDQELKSADHRAKLTGAYTNPKENPETIERQRQITEKLIARFVDRDGMTREEAIAEIIRVKPEAKDWIN